jgi:hypothetical protein
MSKTPKKIITKKEFERIIILIATMINEVIPVTDKKNPTLKCLLNLLHAYADPHTFNKYPKPVRDALLNMVNAVNHADAKTKQEALEAEVEAQANNKPEAESFDDVDPIDKEETIN